MLPPNRRGMRQQVDGHRFASMPEVLDGFGQAKLYDGAGFIVAFAYMNDLWRLGAALPPASGDGLKRSATMMFLYSFALITVDGPQCADPTAPRAVQR